MTKRLNGELASQMGISYKKVHQRSRISSRVQSHARFSGCRLGIIIPRSPKCSLELFLKLPPTFGAVESRSTRSDDSFGWEFQGIGTSSGHSSVGAEEVMAEGESQI